MTHDELQNNSSDTGTKVPMTHDELLAELDKSIKGAEFEGRWMWTTNAKALRAVVELAMNLQDDDPFHEDAGWNAGYNYAMYEVIQAIKKELV